MTTPSELADLVIATANGRAIDDRPGLLVVQAPLADPATRARWLDLRGALPAFVSAISIIEADGDAELDPLNAPGPDEPFRITVQTPRVDGELRLFLPGSIARYAGEFAHASQVLIAGMGEGETFSTYRNRVQLWTNDPPEAFAASELLPDPRAYASDFTGEGQVPEDIRPWLVRGAPARVGEAYKIWSLSAGRALMAALADRVSKADGVLSYHFSGPPACGVEPTDDEIVALMPRLQEGATWVFTETRDADTRHLLLAAEWARSHRKGELALLGDGAFESAKSAHAAYVKAGSKEALKALSELRKTVVDEGQKASQRAQDLAGAMWKDLAIATVPFVLKILPDASKASSRTLAATLAFCAAAFLIFSFGMQVFINKRYFRRQREGRLVWKREVNVALRNKEIEELSEEPLNNSLRDYRTVRFSVGIVYSLLVISLIFFAWFNLRNPAGSVPPPPPPKTEAPKAPPPVQAPAREPEGKDEGTKHRREDVGRKPELHAPAAASEAARTQVKEPNGGRGAVAK